MDIQLITTAKEIACLGLSDQDLDDHVKTHYPTLDARLLSSIAQCYHALSNMDENINAEAVSNIINDHHLAFDSQGYLGHILASEKGINPVIYFSEILEKEHFWRTKHVFESSFSSLPKCTMDELLSCISNCLGFTSDGCAPGFNDYFASHFEQNCELLDFFLK